MLEERRIPNSLIYVALITIEDLVGINGLHSVLNMSGLAKFKGNYPANNSQIQSNAVDFSALVKGMIDVIGMGGAKAIMRSAGRRGFQFVVEKSPELFGLVGIELKKLDSDDERIMAIQGAISYETNKIFGEGHQEFRKTEDGYEIRINRCSWCHAIKGTDRPVCFGEEGFDDESVFWATGKRHRVVETECRAMGAPACVFVISATPIE
jgi:predicted hydrocarbon binding protein